MQKAAIAALEDEEHLQRTLQTIRNGRAFLYKRLQEIGFLVTPDPQGNFLFSSPSPAGVTAKGLLKRLLRKGIAVRGPPADWTLDYLRISVGTAAQNEKLISSIGNLL